MRTLPIINTSLHSKEKKSHSLPLMCGTGTIQDAQVSLSQNYFKSNLKNCVCVST